VETDFANLSLSSETLAAFNELQGSTAATNANGGALSDGSQPGAPNYDVIMAEVHDEGDIEDDLGSFVIAGAR